jgi:hypothetical protein
MGGSSIGIAFVGSRPALEGVVVIPGKGGSGGPAPTPTIEAQGQDGAVVDVLELEGAASL